MKIVFMGSSSFACPSLELLVKTRHELALIVCQPDKPAGRGLKLTPCPVGVFADSHNIPSFKPPTLRDKTAAKKIGELKPRVIVVAAYGKILPKEILELPPLGSINLHASLLPKYRGAAPINWAVVKGEDKTGVTTMMMNEKMDAGDILFQREVGISPEETAFELGLRLAEEGAGLLIETLDKIEEGRFSPVPQDEKQVTYAPILKKENGLIEWAAPAKDILNLIRGMQPWPVAFTHSDGKVMRIFKAKLSDEKKTDVTPGTVVESKTELAVATGSWVIYLLDVQMEGKKRMTAAEFLRGHKIKSGDVLK